MTEVETLRRRVEELERGLRETMDNSIFHAKHAEALEKQLEIAKGALQMIADTSTNDVERIRKYAARFAKPSDEHLEHCDVNDLMIKGKPCNCAPYRNAQVPKTCSASYAIPGEVVRCRLPEGHAGKCRDANGGFW